MYINIEKLTRSLYDKAHYVLGATWRKTKDERQDLYKHAHMQVENAYTYQDVIIRLVDDT